MLEADAVGSHASGFAFGEMGALEGAGIPDPLLDFTLWSLERHRTLALEAADAVPIARGEHSIVMQVHITWQIK